MENQPEEGETPPVATGDPLQVVPKVANADDQKKDEAPLEVRDGHVRIDEEMLLSEMRHSSSPADLIIDLDGFEDVRELGQSRFGSVHLLRRRNSNGTFEDFAAKFYNMGENREGRGVFEDRMKQLLELSHPHVMPIVGMIPGTKTTGPIFLTPYSEIGSLETVLSAVRRNEPPPNWNNGMKLGLIVSLVSGLNYLHKNGIVHRELKPNDLIIESNGTLRVCGYATSILEEHKYTKATQVGGPSYMPPEIYDDDRDGKKLRDPKTDVFSFGLLLFEILFDQKVFPSTMSTAAIMRKMQSDRARDRPMVRTNVHKILQEIISRSWVPSAAKRPSMEMLWNRMRDVGFDLFPGVVVTFIPSSV
jgi:serine/threonine protein kinase